MGHRGAPSHPDVHAAILNALTRIAAAGKTPGIMSLADLTDTYVDAGARFVAVGIDVQMLALKENS